MADNRNPCEGCPLLTFGFPPTITIMETRRRIDEGVWIPCKETVRDPVDQSVSAKVEAWRVEKECVAARQWRSR